VAFSNPAVTFGAVGLAGENTNNPTALDFSKSGNPVLFVTQQNGEIWRYEIERQTDGPDGDTLPEFVVTAGLFGSIREGADNRMASPDGVPR